MILNFFSKPGSFATANAFQDGLKEGHKGQAIWADAIRRIEALKLFRDRALADAAKSSSVNQRLESYFSGIDQNIRLVSTYPSMLLLSYHLARLKFSLKIFTWTGLLEIHAGTILEYFFSGGLTPWFPYSNDRSPIQASQIPIIVHYALELGLLSDGGTDPATFVSLLATQMAGSPSRATSRKSTAPLKLITSSTHASLTFIASAKLKNSARRQRTHATLRHPSLSTSSVASPLSACPRATVAMHNTAHSWPRGHFTEPRPRPRRCVLMRTLKSSALSTRAPSNAFNTSNE
ncbi:MAG: hypothetical protein IPJ84_14540 [Bdellovibrionales bacterium]|nr:hypothetical protein [Bdellovibrionales bacterium]